MKPANEMRDFTLERKRFLKEKEDKLKDLENIIYNQARLGKNSCEIMYYVGDIRELEAIIDYLQSFGYTIDEYKPTPFCNRTKHRIRVSW